MVIVDCHWIVPTTVICRKKLGLQEIFLGWLKRWIFITTKTALPSIIKSKVNTVCNGWHRSVRVFYWLCCTDSQLHKENLKIHNSTILQQGNVTKYETVIAWNHIEITDELSYFCVWWCVFVTQARNKISNLSRNSTN